MIPWLNEARGPWLFSCFCSIILKCCIFLPMLVTTGCKMKVSLQSEQNEGRKGNTSISSFVFFFFLIRKQNLSRKYLSEVPLSPSGLDPKPQGRLSNLHSGREKGRKRLGVTSAYPVNSVCQREAKRRMKCLQSLLGGGNLQIQCSTYSFNR